MRRLLFIALVLCAPTLVLCNPGPAPDVLCFAVGGSGPCAWPEIGDQVVVTLYLDDLYFASEGILGVRFALERTFGGTEASFRNLFAGQGGLVIGDPEVPPGVAMTTGPCALPNPDDVIPFARITYLYTGPAGILTPIPYALAGGSIFVDCDNLEHELAVSYEPGGAAGIGMEPPTGCGTSPVGDMTWGSIKALYR